MRVSKKQAADNRERILQESARLFRERGFAGVGVADLMRSAGLTHGGFYGHFASKDDLMAQASARALAQSAEDWTQVVERASAMPLTGFMAAYLAPEHRDNPGEGCLLAALGTEIARADGPVRRAVTDGLQAIVEVLAEAIPEGSESERRADVLAMYASAVGTLVLARAVDDPDFSDEILAATARALAKGTATGDD